MPQPDRQQYIDQDLGMTASGYWQSQMNYVATRAFPMVPVSKQEAKYYLFDKNSNLRSDMQRRANGEESAGSGFKVSNESYVCDVFALHKDITNQDRANWAIRDISIEEATAQWLTQQALQTLERQFIADVFAAGNWGSANKNSPSTKWTDQSSGDPIGDCRSGIKSVLSNTGFKPNVALFGYDAFEEFTQHETVLARVTGGSSSGSPANVSAQVAAQLIGVDEVIVAQAVGATNVENETAAQGFLASDHVLFLHRPASPSMVMPSTGYTFVWEGVGDGSSLISISRIDAPLRNAERLEIEMGFVHKITGSDLGFFLYDVVS